MIFNNIKSLRRILNVMYTYRKAGATKDLVEIAIKTGFRGIDTACQPKHYNERGVGDALISLYNQGIVKRKGT